MELEQLRIFCAAAERGSLSRAAAALYISHSTVSRAVSALEASLGAELFSRDSRGVSLTPSGQLLFDGAQELLRLAGELEGKVRNTGGKI